MEAGTARAQRLIATAVGLLPFIICYLVFLYLLWPIELRPQSDDTTHIAEIQQLGILQWVRWRAQVWQPRYTSDLGIALFQWHLPAWKVLNAGAMTLLLWLVTRVALIGDTRAGGPTVSSGRWWGRVDRRALTVAVFACLLAVLVHPNVVTSGAVWYSGSFNYLWPVTAMMVGLVPFFLVAYGRALPRPYLLVPLCALVGIAGCFTEQTAAVTLGVASLVLARLVVKRTGVPAALVGQFALTAVVGCLFFYGDITSPRLTDRTEISLFPAFADFSGLDKLMLGVNVYTTHLLHVSNILFTVLALTAGWLAYRRWQVGSDPAVPRWRRLARVSVFAPGVWALVNTLPLPWGYTQGISERLSGRPSALGFGLPGWLGYLDNTRPLADAIRPGPALLALLGLACVLCLFGLLWCAFAEARDRYVAVVLYAAASLSGVIIGFSPSVWASGSRPNFLSNVFLVLVLVMLVRSRMRVMAPASVGQGSGAAGAEGFSLRDSWPARIALIALVVFALVVLYLYHTLFATNSYWWY